MTETTSQGRAAVIIREQSALAGFIIGNDTNGTLRRVSMVLSLIASLVAYLFFMKARGWAPTPESADTYSTYIGWALQAYVLVQSLILIVTSTSQRRGEIAVDILTSFVPVIIVLFALRNHLNGLEVMSFEQARYAKTFLGAMVTDLVLDLGVGLLSVSRTMNVGS